MQNKDKIKLKISEVNEAQQKLKFTDTKFAKYIGISRSRLWRARLPESHQEYCTPGEDFIAGILRAFPNKSFDDFFFLD